MKNSPLHPLALLLLLASLLLGMNVAKAQGTFTTTMTSNVLAVSMGDEAVVTVEFGQAVSDVPN